MRILILNWRDPNNPLAGGAERLTLELAKRWVAAGHSVTIFCAGFSGAKKRETIDGVSIIRRGRWWNVHIFAFFYYLLHIRHSVDVIVDEVHWYPFFSVLYAPRKTVLLACEVAHRLFFQLFPYPAALPARCLEKIYFFLYRKVPVLAISPSTKRELIEEGVVPGQITVLPMGISIPKTLPRTRKNAYPTLLFLGRLHKLKGVVDAIDAFVLIRKHKPSAKLWIVGSGQPDYQRQLRRYVETLGLAPLTTFFGQVTEERKLTLLSQAHLLLMPSAHEGWGLVVSEAAYMGTPTVSYNSPGLRDVVAGTKAGVLTRVNTPQALAEEALRLLDDKRSYRRYQEEGKKQTSLVTWEDTARAALSVLRQRYEKHVTSNY